MRGDATRRLPLRNSLAEPCWETARRSQSRGIQMKLLKRVTIKMIKIYTQTEEGQSLCIGMQRTRALARVEITVGRNLVEAGSVVVLGSMQRNNSLLNRPTSINLHNLLEMERAHTHARSLFSQRFYVILLVSPH